MNLKMSICFGFNELKTYYKEAGSGDRQCVGSISWNAAVTSIILFTQAFSLIGPWEMM